MTDLFEPRGRRSIQKAFLGTRVRTDEIIDKPIQILDFEIGLGKKSGNPVAYCQIKHRGEYRFWWTEAYKIIRRLQVSNRAMLPFMTKVGWDDDGKYLIFKKVKL